MEVHSTHAKEMQKSGGERAKSECKVNKIFARNGGDFRVREQDSKAKFTVREGKYITLGNGI
jgi:hypothetical protein